MKVKEIIALASAICGMEDVEGAIFRYEKAKEEEVDFAFEEGIEAKIDKAIKCINLTMSRIASEYLSLKKRFAISWNSSSPTSTRVCFASEPSLSKNTV